MQKAIGWLVTPLFIITFAVTLGVFHILQVLARCMGYSAHKFIVDCMCWCLLQGLRVGGTRISFSSTLDDNSSLPEDRPIIFVANHQSMFDIPVISWFLRTHHPKFIAKKELGKGIPSVSYNLRNGGSILIDRSNPRQALPEIEKLGNYIKDRNFSAVIYPEGTRARDGMLKNFKPSGFLKIKKTVPEAQVVPLVIQGSWELLRYGLKPFPFGVKFSLTVLKPLSDELSPKEQLALAEKEIRSYLGQ